MPRDTRDPRWLYAGPIRAEHHSTREVRGWIHRAAAEAWLTTHDVLADWDLVIDKNPAWGLDPRILPRPDGTPCDGVPVYATPDGRPAS